MTAPLKKSPSLNQETSRARNRGDFQVIISLIGNSSWAHGTHVEEAVFGWLSAEDVLEEGSVNHKRPGRGLFALRLWGDRPIITDIIGGMEYLSSR